MTEATISKTVCPVMPLTLSSDNACLIRIHPTDELGGIWQLNDSCVMGRVADCDIQVMDESASRHHAVIRWDGENFVLADLGSTNGTLVNDQLVTEQILAPEDRICIGQQIFKFLAADHIEVQYHNTLYRMVTTDALTQAHNRKYMEEQLDREFNRATRHGRPLALLMMDIDFFKSVNDEHGHLAGDEVLKEFARRVRATLNDEVLCRYGGEEFAVVAGECEMPDAIELAKTINEAIRSEPFTTSDGPLEITVSIGVVEATQETCNTPMDLLAIADQRLYVAKESGRDRFCAG